jgi:drug/metabolite transporter (DMT)-like permease
MGLFLCLLSAACFAALGIFGKLAFDDDVNTLTLLFVRFGLAAVVFGGLRLLVPAMRGRPLPRRAQLTALGLGAVGYAAQAGLYFGALHHVDVSLLSLLLYTFPAFVTIAAIVLGRERVSGRRIGALAVASAGTALVLAGSGAGHLDAVGALMGIGAAVTYTAYILVADTVVADIPPVQLSMLIAVGATATFGVAGLVSGGLHFGFGAGGWGWLVCIALVSTVVAVLAFFGGLARVGASNASILSTFEPAVTVLLAFLVFSDRLTAVQLGGGALVLAAAAILQMPSRATPI